jgi:hypothetical protein
MVLLLGMSVGGISRPARATPGNLNPKTQVQKTNLGHAPPVYTPGRRRSDLLSVILHAHKHLSAKSRPPVRARKSHPPINIARLLSSEPWSLAQPSLLGRRSRRRDLIGQDFAMFIYCRRNRFFREQV